MRLHSKNLVLDKVEFLILSNLLYNDEYVRKWITEGGEESILEIYKKVWHSNKWCQSMVGYGDNVFYEEMLE